MRVAVMVTFGAWLALEFGLLIRDRVRGKGSRAADRGTRSLLSLAFFVAIIAGVAVDAHPGPAAGWQMGRWHLAAGLAAACAGLAVRAWAVAALGGAFRTTVEVDHGQAVVDTGPYRWVRHPAYTGLLLVALGFGFALRNWLALAALVLLPLLATLRRIVVEEAALREIMGEPYRAYQERTKRLLPGVW